VDGPGYADERIAVCEETLARIDPTWNCFDCISREMVDALIDADRAQEACEFAEKQRQAMLNAGQEISAHYYTTHADALASAKRYDKALEILKFADTSELQDDTNSSKYLRAELHACILAKIGHAEQAWDALPQNENAANTDHYYSVEAIALIVDHLPQHNSWMIGKRIEAVLWQYSQSGSHRMTLNVADHHIRLAVARGARWTARQALELARPHLVKLRKPLGAVEKFALLEQLVADMPDIAELPVPAEQLADYLRTSDTNNPERDVEWLLAAASQRPGDDELACHVAAAMHSCGAKRDACDYLWGFTKRQPAVHRVASELLSGLLKLRDYNQVEQLANMLSEHNPSLSHWCRARLAFNRKSWSEVGGHIQKLLEIDSDAHQTKNIWADAAMADKDFETALGLRLDLAERESEIGNAHWNLIVAASAAQRWDMVRKTAQQLDFRLDSMEGVVEEKWGTIRLRFFENNEWVEYYARRTGPATARITSIAAAKKQQHVRDWVVYDPYPLEPVPESVEEREDFIQLYEAIHVLQPGGYGASKLVDGSHPGDERFKRLAQELDAHQLEWSVWSSDDYTVTKADTQETLPGLYFLVAAPKEVSVMQLHNKLTELTADFVHPMCWPRLAREAGADEEYHLSIVDQYGL
jgi:hypothetical protein